MSSCSTCSSCFGSKTCASADKPFEAFIRELPMETSHHRVDSQSTKCGFGLQGVCCRLCANVTLPDHPQVSQRNLRCGCGYDRCPQFPARSSLRKRMLYPYCGEYSAELKEHCSGKRKYPF